MTETTVATVVATETVAARLPRRALAGVLSNIERQPLGEGEIVFASLATTYKGIETIRTLAVSGEALATVDHLLVEGDYARFYGEIGEAYVTVIGPDLTKRTMAREAAKNAAPSPAPVTAKATKRPVSEKQREAGRKYFAMIRQKAAANRQARLAAGQTA